MNKQIISEISRIHEIMGILPKILVVEQKQGLIDIGLNFLSSIMKGVDRGLVKLAPTISRESFEQSLRQILQRIENGLPLSPTEQALYARIVSQVLPDLTKQSFEQSFIPAVREIAKTMPALGETNLLKVLRNPKNSDETVVNALWKAYGGGTKNPLIPDLTKADLMAFRKMAMNDVRGSVDETPINKLPKIRPEPTEDFVNPTPDEPTPTPPDETTPTPPDETTPTPPDETTPTPPDVNNSRYINRHLQDIPELTEDEILRISRLNKGFLKALYKMRQSILDTFTSTARLQDEIALLARNMRTPDVDDPNPANLVSSKERIKTLFETISNRDATAFDEIKTFLETQIRPYNYETYQRLIQLDSFKRAEAILSKKSLKEWIEKYGTISERRGKMWKSVIGEVINPVAWFGKSMSKYQGKWPFKVLAKWKDILYSGPEYRELRAYLATGQTKDWEMMKEYAEKMGGFRLGASVAKEWAYNYLITAIMISFFEYVRDVLSMILGDSKLAEYLDWLAKNKDNLENKGVTFDFGRTEYKFPNSLINLVEGTSEVLVDAVIYLFEEAQNPNLKLPGIVANYLAFYGSMKKDPTTIENIRETVDGADTLVRQSTQIVQNSTENTLNEIKFEATKPSFLAWCAKEGKLPFTENSWDEINKIGTTNDGKKWKLKDDKKGFEETTNSSQTQTTTLSENEIKTILKDWMNKNGWNNQIGNLDFPYMKNLGNNRWEYEDEDGKKYAFEFNSTNKTFKEL